MFFTRDDHKINIIGGLLLLGLTLSTGIAVYSAMRQQIESVLGIGLRAALQGKALLVENQIQKGMGDTHTLSLRPFLIQSMQELNAQPENKNALHDLKRNVNSLPESGFSAAVVYDAKGNTLSQIGHFSKNVAQSIPLPKHNDTLLIWDNQFILRTQVDIKDQEKRHIGRILTEIKLPQVTRRFSEIRSIGKTGEFILCAPPTADTQAMACFISQIDGIKFTHLRYARKGGVLPISLALNGTSGVIAVKDYRHIPVIEAYAPLHGIDLGMILKLDQDELFSPINDQLMTIVFYLAGLIIAEILLLNWFVRKLIRSERESRNAKETAEQISIELSHKEIELRERLKEITCLYEIRRNIGLDLSVDKACQQIITHLIPAMQYPEHASVIIELDGKRISSAISTEYMAHELNSKITVNGTICGQLRVFYPQDKPFLASEEQKLIDAITSDLARWLERKKIEELLRERLKEITCLYEIRRGIGMESSIDNVCQNIFEHLIPAMQFPNMASAVIELNGWKFTIGKFDPETRHRLQSKAKVTPRETGFWRAERNPACTCCALIYVNGKVCGQIRVFYPADHPYLMVEEQNLINAIASELESWLERKRLEQALVLVAEEQSHTIGQELHDNLGQEIAAIGYQARALEKQIVATGNTSMATVAASIASQAQISVIHIKQLAQGLLPFEIEANGLVAALQALANRVSTTYSISCLFSCENNIIIQDNTLALNLYRIAQEATNNAIRHGKAQHITLSLSLNEELLCLSIADDGSGFIEADEASQTTSGMGIKIMQYRAKQLGAKLSFLSRAEGGTEVRLEMRMA
ncbi:ATP-binding protein [uncultured Nitrosomonas sp.]|uniref:sensor histidine kinase n=1 Tax=uncultured Nitrosomonas sp. TaxID=156424 RepID=UPI0025D953CB|nr:ATP-binding protein [uncultured Nitrosomonas sp.]